MCDTRVAELGFTFQIYNRFNLNLSQQNTGEWSYTVTQVKILYAVGRYTHNWKQNHQSIKIVLPGEALHVNLTVLLLLLLLIIIIIITIIICFWWLSSLLI